MKRKVYYLSSPEDLVPRYVGCTKIPLKKRLIGHIYDSKRDHDDKSLWIKSLLERHIRPMLTLVAEVQDWEDWEERERYYIALFREKYSLLNMADGGQGCPGTTHTKEWLEKVRATNATKINPLSKRVICVETGEIYACARDACKALGMEKSNVSASIRGGGTAGGYHWKYLDNE